MHAGASFKYRIMYDIIPMVGIYDAFSARIASKFFDGIFLSGFSFAASHYGLPDIGYVTWSDMLAFASKIRKLLPEHHILVDIDDGYGDEIITSTVTSRLSTANISAVMLEDQKRPRRCGHFAGKELLPMEEYLIKLDSAVKAAGDMFVVARTDATDPNEGIARAVEYEKAGADGVIVEAVRELDVVSELRSKVRCPIMINQIHGGKTPNWELEEMRKAGASIVIYSTPCLSSAQWAMEEYLGDLLEFGALPDYYTTTLNECRRVLHE